MQVKVFADSKESLENTLHFLKCYALASEAAPPLDPASLVRTHHDIDSLKSSDVFKSAFDRALSAQEPLEVRPISNGADMTQTLASYLNRPPADIDAAFSSAHTSGRPHSPMMAKPSMDGTLYETSINIPAENPILDHYALSKGMFVVRGKEGAAIYSSIELAAQQTNRMAVMQKVEETMQYADPFARQHD